MSKFIFSVCCFFLLINSKAQTITLANVSQDIFCSTGNDTVKFSVDFSGISPNTNIVFYQSTNAGFNPYAGQGDSIGFIHIDSTNSGGSPIYTNCPTILGIFIDACNDNGRSEPANEYMVITSGNTGFLASNLGVDVPNNVAPPGGSGLPPNSHNDINIGPSPCSFGTPSTALMDTLRKGACNSANLIAADQSTFIPANALVVIFTGNGTNYPYNFSSFCSLGQPIYILQNSCTRDTSSGAFVNNEPNNCTSASNAVRYRNTSITVGACFDEITYDRCGLGIFNAANPNANDGNYVIRLPNTDTSSVANGGILNNSADKCNGVVLDSAAGTQIISYKIPNDGSVNPLTNFCNTGYHYIKAITHPNGTQPVSNAIQFKLVCLSLNADAPNNIICSGQNAVINNTSNDPNATFSWGVLPGPNITGASAGSGTQVNQTLNNTGTTPDSVTYFVTAQDGPCNITQAVKIYVNPVPTPFSLGPDTSVCGAFSKTLSTGNPATVWSTGATASSITVNTTGTYWARISNSCGTVTDTIKIFPSGVTPFSLGPDTTVCGAFSKTLSTGDPSTSWSTGATAASISINAAGVYWAKITGACGFFADTIQIFSDSTRTINLGPDKTVCGNVNEVLSTGYANTLWSTGVTAASITVTDTGTYWAKITTPCGTTSDTVRIQKAPAINVSITGNTSICSGNATTLGVTGGPYDSLRWSTNETTTTISVSTQGSYSVTVYDNGCSGTASTNVTVGALNVNITGKLAICSGDTTTLDAGPGYTSYNWSTGETTQTIRTDTAGHFIVDVTQGSCSASDTVDVTNAADPVVNITGDSILCFGESTTLDAGSGFTSYSWSTGATKQVIGVNVSGQYIVTVSNGSCSARDTFNVYTYPEISFSLDVVDVTCPSPGKITVINMTNGIPPFTYQINNGPSQAVDSFTNLGPGDYTVTVTDSVGCTAMATASLVQPTPIELELGPNANIQLGQTYEIPGTLINAYPPVTYNWTPSDSLSCTDCVDPVVTPDSTTTYVLLVTDDRGCMAIDSVTVFVFELIDIFLPTAFTPNSSIPSNQVLTVLGDTTKASVVKFIIFDRWGEKLFEQDNFPVNDQRFGWDGTYKGSACLMDAYGFYILARTYKGEEKEYKGTVTLFR